MSLVNDMLKDLETRWPQADQAQSEDGIGGVRLQDRTAGNDEYSIPGTLSSSSSKRLGNGPWLLIACGLAVFAAVVSGHYFWSLHNSSNEQPVLTPLEKVLVDGEPTESSAAVPDVEGGTGVSDKPLLPETVVKEGQLAANQVAAYKTPPTVDFLLDPEPVAQMGSIEERIAALMAEGDAALRLDRLTTPKEDNAFDRYSAVLALQPEHSGAQVGLNKVRTRYLEIVEIAIIKKYYYKVPELIRKAREIGVSQSRIDTLIAGLPEKDGKPTKEVLQRIAEYEASRGIAPAGSNVDPTETDEIEASVVASQPVTEIEAPKAVITSSVAQRDRTVAIEAQQLMAQNQLPAAQFLLEQFVAENPTAVYSFRELFNLRLRQQRLPMAEAMIKDADHIPGEVFSYMVAQLLIQREDFEGALRALQSQSPSIEADAGYHALLAGVYHKLGRHQRAASSYRELLGVDSANPTYWLGLAVALDAMQQQGALAAFQKVQQLAQGGESFLPYVRNRIGSLASNR